MITLLNYYWCLNDYLRGNCVKNCKYFKESKLAQVQIYTLSMMLTYFNHEHYRHETLKDDLILNLQNVYIPYTNITYSFWCKSTTRLYIFVYIIYPLLTVFNRGLYYHLTDPNDLFSLWRINCMVNYHIWLYGKQEFKELYLNENKKIFIDNCIKYNIPVSPCLNIKDIVIKHINREGGQAFFNYKNSNYGGDWIIQEKLNNCESLLKYLPNKAPLSTFRLVTLNTVPLLCVWRAGHNNAETDHKNTLYSVNLATGIIENKIINDFCYKSYSKKNIIKRSRSRKKRAHIIGSKIQEIDKMNKLVTRAHKILLPNVPIAGWDIALTKEHGMILLEVNLGCNLHSNKFDKEYYVNFIKNIVNYNK